MSQAITFVVVAWIYSYAHQYLWDQRIVPVMQGYWYLIAAGLALVIAIIPGKRRVSPTFDLTRYRRNRRLLIVWAVAFGVVALVSYLMSPHYPQNLRAMKNMVVEMGLVAVFLLMFRGEREIASARWAVLAVALLTVVTNLTDFFGITSFTQTAGRGAGMYVNPNISGFYLTLGMILTVTLVPRRYRVIYCGIIGIGVLATFSRGAMLMWLVGLFGLVQLRVFNVWRSVSNIVIVGIVALGLAIQFGAVLVSQLGLDQYLTEDAVQRVHFDFNTDTSVQDRMGILQSGWKMIQQAPWFGHGIGAHLAAKTLIAPHNMFVLMGVEMGMVGVILFLALAVALWRMSGGLARVFACAFVVGSLFTHNVFDYSASVVAIVLLAGVTPLAWDRELERRKALIHQRPSRLLRNDSATPTAISH